MGPLLRCIVSGDDVNSAKGREECPSPYVSEVKSSVSIPGPSDAASEACIFTRMSRIKLEASQILSEDY